MKSVRLDQAREVRLREAAQQYGISQSEFIRRAIDKACDEALAQPSLYDLVKDIIDSTPLDDAELGEPTDSARRHSQVFGEIVARKHARHLDSAQRILADIERHRPG